VKNPALKVQFIKDVGIRPIPELGRMPIPRGTDILPVSAQSKSKEWLVLSAGRRLLNPFAAKIQPDLVT
jgi:hypothetical protein